MLNSVLWISRFEVVTGRIIVGSDLVDMAQAGCFGLSRKAEEIRRSKPPRIPLDASVDGRMERPGVAGEQGRHLQHTLEEAGAVELRGIEAAVTQQSGQMSRREMLVPALGSRDVADQTIGITDVSPLVVGL